MWGLLIGPLLRADDGGVFYAGSFRMLLWNSVGILAIVAWNGIVCLLLFASLNKVHIYCEVEAMAKEIVNLSRRLDF